MAVWPVSLPPPALNTFRETPPNNALRSTMDKGPAKLRRRTTANVRPVSFSLNLTELQRLVLDDFYVNTTFSGVDEFTWTHPKTAVAYQVRFTKPPDYSDREGIVWTVPIELELLP